MYNQCLICSLLVLMIFYFLVDTIHCDYSSEVSEWNEIRRNESVPLSSLQRTFYSYEDSPSLPEEVDKSIKKRKRKRIRRRFRRLLFPILLAYKLKFLALIPMLLGGLVLLAGSTGLAGFFFALFAAALGLKAGSNRYW